MRIPKNRPPTHPGQVLKEEFLIPMGMSGRELARRIRVCPSRIHRLCRGEGRVTTELANLLARGLKTSAAFWINLQAGRDRWRGPHQPS